MMSRKTITAGLTTLALACGVTLLSSTPATAAIVHEYEGEIKGSETPAGSFLPLGVAVDNTCDFVALSGSACTSFDHSNGDVYVADWTNGVVDKFSSGIYQSQLTGPTGASFGHPRGLAVDQSNGDVYVIDESHNVVDKFNSAGAYICQITGSTTPSTSECDGATGSATPEGSLKGPESVAVDQSTGDVYVADTFHQVVDKFNSSGAYVSQLTGTPSGHFSYVHGVAAANANSDVYVADNGYGVVDKFDSAGKFLWEHAFPKSSGLQQLAVDELTGDLYVPDKEDGVLDELDSSGTLLSEINKTSLKYPPITERPNEFRPYAVAIDSATGDVYIGDGGNSVVDVFGPALESPEAFTGPLSHLQPTSATLEGEVNPKHSDTTSFFEYGPELTCPNGNPNDSKQPTLPSDNGSGVINVPVEAHVTGLVPNQAYHYVLRAHNKNGDSHECIERVFTTSAIPPDVETSQPSFVGFEAAALSGSLNPEHSDTTYRFEYGQCAEPAACPASSYTSVTPAQKSAVYGVVGASQEIEGLQPSSTYHYRLVASNSAGAEIVNGPPEVTFTTEPAPALMVATGVAGGVTQTSAMISGTLDPNGLASSYGFQIGTQAGVYGPEVGVGRVELGIFETRSVTLALQNLQPGTTYHYRSVASNAYNAAVDGADETFRTASASSPFTQPLTPSLLATPPIPFPIESTGSKSRKKCKRGYRRDKHGKCVKSKKKTKGRGKGVHKKRK
jgi:DNA-binding beta-propeller fold protein YncE